MVLGTAQYMSPEQARGLEVDARTDIWSLGCVLYEMIAGQQPFHASTKVDVMSGILSREPGSLLPYLSEGPREYDRIVSRALRKDREERYQSVKDLLIDLKDLKRAVETQSHKSSISSAPTTISSEVSTVPEKSIAVLYFESMNPGDESDYFCAGITEDIITDLSKVSGLFVIARNSSFAYKGKSPDVRQVSRELGVRYVLEGSVRRAASRIRINAQMIDGATGGHVWAERYDRDLSDIFAVQDEVTRTIVGALQVKLTAGEEARREGRAKVSPEAYDLLVRARATMMQLRPEAAIEARGMLEQVIAMGSGLALAYARLSILSFAEYANLWNGATEENLTRGLEFAKRAIEADEAEPQGHIAMALALAWLKRLDEAEGAAERAVELGPNSADAYAGLGNIRDFQGRHEESVALHTRAYRLDPQFDMSLHFLGRSLLALDRFYEAEIAFKKRLVLSPHSDMSRFYLACLYGRTGRHEEARRMWEEMLGVNPNFSLEHLRRALPYRDPTWLDRLVEGLRAAGIKV
jgi:adenylate cyclase